MIDVLQVEINQIKRTTNTVQQFHRTIHLIIYYLKYITVCLYALRNTKHKSSLEVCDYIISNFCVPSEGHWLSLLNKLLKQDDFYGIENLNKTFKKRIPDEIASGFTNLFSHAFCNDSYSNKGMNYLDFFEKIISVKNKLISHGSCNEDKAAAFFDKINKILDNILEHFGYITGIHLFHIYEKENEIEYHIINSATELKISKEILRECFLHDGLYLFVNEKLFKTDPFLICRDGEILFFNKFIKDQGRVLFNAPNGKEKYIKSSHDNIADIFNIPVSKNVLNPLDVSAKCAKNGTIHNIPEPDCKEYIGREEQLMKLNGLMNHARHFITALDGIGGVGKTALALKYCENCLLNEKGVQSYYDYIVWVSAKETKFVNEQIIKIEKSFEHIEQLLDAILDVLGFSENKNLTLEYKKEIVIKILSMDVKLLLVIDNMETIKKENLKDIWSFVNLLPIPSKVLLTSREFSFEVNQNLSIGNLSSADALQMVASLANRDEKKKSLIIQNANKIFEYSNGLPIAIISIVNQLVLGKSINGIGRDLESSQGNLNEFCFKPQLSLLNDDQLKVLKIVSLSKENINYESLQYMIESEIKSPLSEVLYRLSSLSLLVPNPDTQTFRILPLVKNYILTKNITSEEKEYIEKILFKYYQLKEIDSFRHMPIEEMAIEKCALIPRKLVDKAMMHAKLGEIEEADKCFSDSIKTFPTEPYVVFSYATFVLDYKHNADEAISYYKKANSLSENYINYKKIADIQLRNKNFDSAIKNYEWAKKCAKIQRNKDEMIYSVAITQFEKVKIIRRDIKISKRNDQIPERNEIYKKIIENMTYYLNAAPTIYEGKLIRISRILAESYYGIRNKELALIHIDKAIELSEGEESHVSYKNICVSKL